MKIFEEFKLQKNCEISSAHQKLMFWGLVEMTFGPVYSSFSLPKWQALKMTFLHPDGFVVSFSSLQHDSDQKTAQLASKCVFQQNL